jgi:hypothetical protein
MPIVVTREQTRLVRCRNMLFWSWAWLIQGRRGPAGFNNRSVSPIGRYDLDPFPRALDLDGARPV